MSSENYYDSCYETRKKIGVMINKDNDCCGRPENYRYLKIDVDCVECPYLDPIRKSIWKPGKFELDTEKDQEPEFIRNACLAAQMNANNVDEEGFCFGSLKDGTEELRNTCKRCIHFVKNKGK